MIGGEVVTIVVEMAIRESLERGEKLAFISRNSEIDTPSRVLSKCSFEFGAISGSTSSIEDKHLSNFVCESGDRNYSIVIKSAGFDVECDWGEIAHSGPPAPDTQSVERVVSEPVDSV